LFEGSSWLRRQLDHERTRRERRDEAERNKSRKARLRQQQRHNAPPAPIARASWYQRNRSLVAGYSTIVSAFACCGMVATGAHLMGYDEERFTAGAVTYLVVAGIGIALQGKGKIANMTSATATRVLQAAAICFLICVGAFLVMSALGNS
jgi:hypothetical protein